MRLKGRRMRTELVGIILALSKFLPPWDDVLILVLAHGSPAFCEKYELVSGDVVLLDGLADDFFRHSA
jgi:hypothetical protein